jgi:hypothetical protein
MAFAIQHRLYFVYISFLIQFNIQPNFQKFCEFGGIYRIAAQTN